MCKNHCLNAERDDHTCQMYSVMLYCISYALSLFHDVGRGVFLAGNSSRSSTYFEDPKVTKLLRSYQDYSLDDNSSSLFNCGSIFSEMSTLRVGITVNYIKSCDSSCILIENEGELIRSLSNSHWKTVI